MILDYQGIELGYTSPVGLLLIALGGVSTAFFGARFQCKYNNKSIKQIVTDFFNVKQPVKFYLLVFIFLFLDFAGVITGDGFKIDSPFTVVLLVLKAILVGGIEEIGWRYTFQPELERRHSYIGATFITFFGWSIWHVLYFCVDGSIYFLSNIEIIFFLIGLLTNCFILSVIYKKTNSLWLCVLTHALINAGAQTSPGVLLIVSVLCSMNCIILVCVIVIESGKKMDLKSLSAEETADYLVRYLNTTKKNFILAILFAILEIIVLLVLSIVGIVFDIPGIITFGKGQNITFVEMSVCYPVLLAGILRIIKDIKIFFRIPRIVSEDCDPQKYCEMYERLEGNRRFWLRLKNWKLNLASFYVGACYCIGDYDKALNKLEIMKKRHKMFKYYQAVCAYYEGLIAVAQNDVPKAKECLERTKDLVGNISGNGRRAKNSRDLIIGLIGSMALKEEDFEKAEAMISQRLSGRKDRISRMSLSYALGKAKLGLGKEIEARECFKEAFTLAGDADFELAEKIREAYYK